MSTHPNAILMAVLIPDDLSRKTHRAIIKECGGTDDDIVICGYAYNCRVMEEEYDEDYQIRAPEGSIVVFHFLTYGFGEVSLWSDVCDRQQQLDEWAKGICERHKCGSYEIYISANYW